MSRLNRNLAEFPSIYRRMHKPTQSFCSLPKASPKLISQRISEVPVFPRRSPQGSFDDRYDSHLDDFHNDIIGQITIPSASLSGLDNFHTPAKSNNSLQTVRFSNTEKVIGYFKGYKVSNPHTDQNFTRLRACVRELKFLSIDPETLKKFRKLIGQGPFHRPLARKFLSACKEGDLSSARSLLNQDQFLVYVFDSTKMSALHWAAFRGYLGVVRLLLSRRAYLNPLDYVTFIQRNRTPLHLAAQRNHLSVVEELLAQGTDPCVFTATRKLPLHLASDARIKKTLRLAMTVRNIQAKYLKEFKPFTNQT